jgi:hypothetical protein
MPDTIDMIMCAEFDWQGSRWFGLPVKVNAKTIVVEFNAEGIQTDYQSQLRCPNVRVLRHIVKHRVKTWAVPQEELTDAS